jgi:hypothetical protein
MDWVLSEVTSRFLVPLSQLLVARDGAPSASASVPPQEPKRLRAAAARILGRMESPSDRLPVLLSGRLPETERALQALWSWPFRPRLHVLLDLAEADVPLHPRFANRLGWSDTIICRSALEAEAVDVCLRERGGPLPPKVETVPPPVDPGCDIPRTARARDAVRAEAFGLDSRHLILVFAAGRMDARVGTAMHLFRIFADGHYARCVSCGHVTVAPYRAAASRFDDLDTCACCRAPLAFRSTAHPEARLYIAAPREGATFDVWGLRRGIGLEGRVLVDGDPGLPPPGSREELARGLAAADLLLLPHDRAYLEPALLLARNVGLPVIAPDFGVTQALAGVRRVAPRLWTLGSEGEARAVPDTAQTVAALDDLTRDPMERRRLSEAARGQRDERTIESIRAAWTSLLAAAARDRSRRPAIRPWLPVGGRSTPEDRA